MGILLYSGNVFVLAGPNSAVGLAPAFGESQKMRTHADGFGLCAPFGVRRRDSRKTRFSVASDTILNALQGLQAENGTSGFAAKGGEGIQRRFFCEVLKKRVKSDKSTQFTATLTLNTLRRALL